MTGWEVQYAQHKHWSVWPWSDLVSLVMRFGKPLRLSQFSKVFEFGCGVGANIPFFNALGVSYHSLEGSASAVEAVHRSYPQLIGRVSQGDFTLPFARPNEYAMMVDRASITHNDDAAIRRCLKNVAEGLAPGGLFIGVDWFSTNHPSSRDGRAEIDEWTRTEIQIGTFSGVGSVGFSDGARLRDLFSGFEILLLEEKVIHSHNTDASILSFASWNIVARKSS